MGKSIEHAGLTFNGIYIIKELGRDRFKKKIVLARCHCGSLFEPSAESVRYGKSRSCGCSKQKGNNAKHGHARGYAYTKEYRAWLAMRYRCSNPKAACYSSYGGRGIRVCDEWETDFEPFISHIGPAPSRNHSVDRINVDGNYEPGNVRWATNAEQQANKRK